MINFVLHKNIDKVLWDNCINESENGLIYGLYDYLNCIATHWNALIVDDYKAVLPLPCKSKLGIKYIYHPHFAQQLGLFSKLPVAYSPSDLFSVIPKKYVKYEISFNAENKFDFNSQYKRINYVLDLNDNYDKIYSNFNSNTKRNLKNAIKSNLLFNNDVSFSALLELKKSNMVNNLNSDHFKTLEKLFKYLTNNNLAKVFGIFNGKNQLLSSVIFTHFKNRLVYLFSASNNEGKDKSAMFFLVENIIKLNCGNDLILDFEGSMVPGVAQFFKGFGAQPEYYYRILKYSTLLFSK